MKLSSIKYLTKEGVKNTWANRLMTLASVGVLVACMVIIGLALLIAENANVAIGNLEQQNVVMAYMKDYNWALYNEDVVKEEETSKTSSTSSKTKDDTDEEDSDKKDSNKKDKEEADKNGIKPSDYVIHNEKEAKALCKKIEKLPNVAKVTFVSSEEGLETIKESMLDEQESYFTFLDDEYGNPMSCAAKITMEDMSKFDETLEAIAKLEGIDVIQSQSELADTIYAIKNGITVAGFWIIAILIIISLVIVSNTIRVTMYSRKLEISIMKAVGATDAFVRIPFIVEGMLIGLISAVIAEILVYFCYRVATETIVKTLGTVVKFSDMAWLLLGIFVILGILAGVIGSFFVIGKYLKNEGSEFAAI